MDSSQSKKKRNHDNSQHKPSRKKRTHGIDTTTIILSVFVVILLILVILFLNRNILRGKIPVVAGDSTPPVIERRANEESQGETEKPLMSIEAPEQPDKPIPKNTLEDNQKKESRDNTTARLFFIRVSDEGKISMKSVLRSLPGNGSPLVISIKALLEGPRPNELSNDVLSLIPEDSDLIGARIERGVAFLNFNEQFRFNTLGIEGYKTQVEQIVYTATEFPTVNKVQFLIEGQRIDYLGGEGFWVGGPLGRENF